MIKTVSVSIADCSAYLGTAFPNSIRVRVIARVSVRLRVGTAVTRLGL